MSPTYRRQFLKVTGGLLGGIAVGRPVTAATSTDRFLVDVKQTSRGDIEEADLEIVHDLREIDLLVVTGAESDLEALNATYVPDTTYSLDLPVDDQVPVTASATDEPGYGYQGISRRRISPMSMTLLAEKALVWRLSIRASQQVIPIFSIA